MPTVSLPQKVLTPKLEKLRQDLAAAPGRASTYKEMARLLADLDAPRAASRVLRAGLKQLPDDQGLLENLARVQQAGGFHAAAERTWRRVVSLFPESFLAYEKLERHYVRTGRPERAVRMYRKVEEDHPLEEQSLERQVFVCKEAMDVPGTLKALKKLVRKYGLDFRRARDLGRFHFKANQFREASRWLEKAFSLGEGDRDLRLTLAVSYARQQNFTAARRQIDLILAERPDSFAGLINLCEFTIEEGDLDRAEEILARIEKLYARNSRAALARGEIALARSRWEAAEEALRAGIRGTPYYYRWELERGYRLLGEVLRRTAREAEGDFCLQLASSLRSAPDAYGAFIVLAEEKIGEKEMETASEVIRILERMFPGNSRVAVARAEVEIFKGYPSRAIELLKRQLEKTPEKFVRDKVRGYRVLARAYKQLGDWEGARSSLRQAAALEAALAGEGGDR